jgi:hypothetical protein
MHVCSTGGDYGMCTIINKTDYSSEFLTILLRKKNIQVNGLDA